MHIEAKCLSDEALQIAMKRREVKGKGEKERHTHLNAESQRKAMPKSVQTTAQLHSTHTLKVMLKILQARLQ